MLQRQLQQALLLINCYLIQMNKVTICIPEKWSEGLFQIKSWIEHYVNEVGVSLEISVSGQIDAHEIQIQENSSLNPYLLSAVQNALSLINSEITHSNIDEWKAQSDLRIDLHKNLESIETGLNKTQL
jgi:hypothetical protein